MTFRAASTGRLPAILRPMIAAGDELIRDVAAGKWPRQAAPALGDDAPLPTLRELREIATSPDGRDGVVRRSGGSPPRPEETPAVDSAAPRSPPGGADQARDPWAELDIPQGLRRAPKRSR